MKKSVFFAATLQNREQFHKEKHKEQKKSHEIVTLFLCLVAGAGIEPATS